MITQSIIIIQIEIICILHCFFRLFPLSPSYSSCIEHHRHLGVTRVLQRQKLELSFSLQQTSLTFLKRTGNEGTHIIRGLLRTEVVQLLRLLCQQVGLLRRVFPLGLVISLDGSELGFDALVSFFFLQEPKASLVFDPGKLGVFLLGLEFFL